MAPRSSKPLISQYTLKKLVRYDGRTGQFHWSDNPPRGCIPGAPAGSVMIDRSKRRSGKGSVIRVIRLNGRLYSAARLAWLYVHGEFPGSYLTFNDNDPTNLRIRNLCETSDKYSTTREAAYQRDYRKRIRDLATRNEIRGMDPALNDPELYPRRTREQNLAAAQPPASSRRKRRPLD